MLVVYRTRSGPSAANRREQEVIKEFEASRTARSNIFPSTRLLEFHFLVLCVFVVCVDFDFVCGVEFFVAVEFFKEENVQFT